MTDMTKDEAARKLDELRHLLNFQNKVREYTERAIRDTLREIQQLRQDHKV